MSWGRMPLVAVLAATCAGTFPAAAGADTLFASPTGTAADPCTQADPCSLEDAVETEAVMNDEVVVLPGTHPSLDDTLTVSTTLDLHGLPGQRARIHISDVNGLEVTTSASLSRIADLDITSDGSGVALFLSGPSVIAERLHVTGEGTHACRPSFSLDPSGFPAILRDTACFNASSGDAVGLPVGIAAPITVRLVNVTAVAAGGSGDGIHLGAGNPCNCLINATNVIAAGNEAGGGVDVRATTSAAGTSIATVALDHSNYSSESETGDGVENVTNPGTGNNQIAAPIFAPGAGNFHQTGGSPTIDDGATNPLNGGALDLDGEARAQGTSQDIGADEFTVASPPPPAVPSTPPPPPGTIEVLNAKAMGKKLLLRVRCAAAGGCAGNEIALRSAKKLDLSKIAVAAKRKRILLAKGSASLAAGETGTVRLKLRGRGRRLFRARRKVRAKVAITAAAGSSTETLKVKRK